MNASTLVQKLWNYCNVLRDDGMSYGDYVFTSPSTAAAVELGRSANGRIEWKDAQVRTLKELQAQEAPA